MNEQLEKDKRGIEADILTLRIKKANFEKDNTHLLNVKARIEEDINRLSKSREHFAELSNKAQDEYLANKKKGIRGARPLLGHYGVP